MKFVHKPKHLKLEFTWKEIFFILLRKSFILERKSVYEFSTVLFRIIHDLTQKYGDHKDHGEIKVPKEEE